MILTTQLKSQLKSQFLKYLNLKEKIILEIGKKK